MNSTSTAFRLLVIICVLVLVLLSLLSFQFISPRRILHSIPINLNAPSLKPSDPNYLAVCVPMWKDLSTLPEFIIHHHAHVGIEKYYLVDMSPESDVAENYHELPLNSSYIQWLHAPAADDNETSQFEAYEECQRQYGHKHVWIAYLDVDEFIEVRDKNLRLQDFLHSMDKNSTIGAFGINMLLHTWNKHILKPEGGLRKNFTECVANDIPKSPNAHIKSIVKTKYFHSPRTDHNFNTFGESKTVGEHGDLIPFIFRRPITTDLFAIHHYAMRSKEEFNIRVKAGEVEEPKTFPDMRAWWKAIDELPTMECDSMKHLSP